MGTIAAVLIVKDEESMISKCLESVKDADEIIVVDTGSKDKTCEIARKYTDKVYENEYQWEDSFCKARNYAKGKATADWVLSIDADETIEPDGIKKLRAVVDDPKFRVYDLWLKDAKNGAEHNFPRFFKNDKDIFWIGDIHNYINVAGEAQVNITITYDYSPAHAKDPERAFRILKNTVAENPRCVREKFYLAREYMYRNDWNSAIEWYNRYLEVAIWGPEIAEAKFQLSHAYYNIGDADNARQQCLESIGINADYSSSLNWMAFLTGPLNKERWLLSAESARNQNVLFKPGFNEMGSPYYDSLFTWSKDFSRYQKMYEEIIEWAGTYPVLDAGCGNGTLLSMFKGDAIGIDFSQVAVEQCREKGLKADVANLYDYKFGGDRLVVFSEVLEHMDDIKLINSLPSGTRVIISVPSFPDESHLRIYTFKSFERKFKNKLRIIKHDTFYWNNGWDNKAPYSNEYITLIMAYVIN